MKLPAFQFYPGDWRKDPGIQSLSYHDRGVWFEILCLMHESEERGKLTLGGRPMPEEALGRLLGLDKQNLTTTITTLLTYGVASRCPQTGALLSRRMIRDENLRQIRANAGKQGGNPVLLKQKQTTHLKQITTPSSSSSSSDIQTEPSAPRIPSLKDWQAYCKDRYPDWPEPDSIGAWEYYESLGWKKGKTPIAKWKLCASTCYRNHLSNRRTTSGRPEPILREVL